MSITWEEPDNRGEWVTVEQRSSAAWKKVAGQVAALAILAVIGGAGGAGIAAWKLGDRAATPEAAAVEPAKAAAPAADAKPAREAVAAEPLSGPREIDAAPAIRETVPAEAMQEPPREPAVEPAAASFDPPQLASLFPEGETAFVADAGEAPIEEPVATPDMPGAVPAPAEALAAQETPAGIDVAETASILSPGEPVAVADTREEAARLEALMADEAAGAVTASPDGKPLTPAWADKYVNLRAGPDNDAEIIEIVPANSELLAEEDCVHWCAVVHDGRQGYIYKSFIRR